MFFLSKAARPARYALFSGFAVRALGGLDPSVLLIAARRSRCVRVFGGSDPDIFARAPP